MQEIYRTVSKSLLYSDVIEHDGRLGKEPTLLGAFGILAALALGFGLLVFLGSFL